MKNKHERYINHKYILIENIMHQTYFKIISRPYNLVKAYQKHQGALTPPPCAHPFVYIL